MSRFNRIITIVLDSVGFGELPDAIHYDDVGSDTIGNTAKATGGLTLPNLQKLGIGNLHKIEGVPPIENPKGYYGKMKEASVGKDTMTGHWEMMGLYIDKPFITFTETGFPDELINKLEEKIGVKIIGNKSASGTEIIEELGEQHVQKGDLIVYTSADSVLQIAANEDTFGLDRLYKACEIARELTMEEQWRVGRIIARPFVGKKRGEFKRTSNRHDYALKPTGRTTLDDLKDNGFDVISVGKIIDIFDGEGITESHKTKSNKDGMEITIGLLDKDFKGLMFVNLVDFDSLWGHRRDPEGYKNELEQFDRLLGDLLPKLRNDDLLILTSDHGNDPTHHGTDHTREYALQLYFSPQLKGSDLLPTSQTFADIAATIADNFQISSPENGGSMLQYLV